MRRIKQLVIFIIFLAALLVGGCSTTVSTVVDQGAPQVKQQPAHHTKNGFRNIYDKPKHGKILFAGDTGYSFHFKEIREKMGPMRLALLPIGSYRPRWFMKTIHMDPVDAVSAHKDLQAEQSIAMHWGTFYIADDPLGEPPLYLKKVMKEASMEDDSFLVMKFGETRVF